MQQQEAPSDFVFYFFIDARRQHAVKVDRKIPGCWTSNIKEFRYFHLVMQPSSVVTNKSLWTLNLVTVCLQHCYRIVHESRIAVKTLCAGIFTLLSMSENLPLARKKTTCPSIIILCTTEISLHLLLKRPGERAESACLWQIARENRVKISWLMV